MKRNVLCSHPAYAFDAPRYAIPDKRNGTKNTKLQQKRNIDAIRGKEARGALRGSHGPLHSWDTGEGHPRKTWPAKIRWKMINLSKKACQHFGRYPHEFTLCASRRWEEWRENSIPGREIFLIFLSTRLVPAKESCDKRQEKYDWRLFTISEIE